MRFFTWLGLLFLLAALAVLCGEAWLALTGDEPARLHALGEWWAWIHRDSLLLLQPAIQRHVAPGLWDPIQTVLEWPALADLAVPGVVFLALGRIRRRPKPATGGRLKFRR